MAEGDGPAWSLIGQEFVHCNRAYRRDDGPDTGPTAGPCHVAAGLYIEQGRYGVTNLGGLSIALAAHWPGPVDQGGQLLPIVDEEADADQRRALLAVMRGLESFPGATFFDVFPGGFAQVFDPVYAFIGLVIDVEGRRALLKVPGLIDARGEPILDPATGEPRQSTLDLPGRCEDAIVALGRGWASVTGPFAFETRDTEARFADVELAGSQPDGARSDGLQCALPDG